MRWPVALRLLAWLLVGLSGCRSCDKVETELRAREEDVRTLREDLGRVEFHNQLLSRELQAFRGIPLPDGTIPTPSEPYPVRSVRLGRGTSGRPSESCPGDDALQVMLEPLDCQSQAIKAPGHLSVAAVEVSTEGIKRPLSVWELTPTEMSARWQNGLFTTGYVVTLPWKVWPGTEKLRVVARFRLVDGRVFEADKDITVRVVPVNKRPAAIVTEDVLPTTPVIPTPTPAVPLPAAQPEVAPAPRVAPSPAPAPGIKPSATIAPIVPDAPARPAPEAIPHLPMPTPKPGTPPAKPTAAPATILPPVRSPDEDSGPRLGGSPAVLLRPVAARPDE